MKKIIFTAITVIFVSLASAQQDSFDLVHFTPLKGWKKETFKDVVALSITDNNKNTWCKIGLYKSIPSKGSIEKDFESEWQQLVVKTYKVTEAPQVTELPETDGWKIKGAGAAFTSNNATNLAMLTTFSGHGKALSVLVLSNSKDYLPAIQQMMDSIVLDTTGTNSVANDTNISSPVTQTKQKTNFGFTRTNFDDGWVGECKEDWAEVSLKDIKVLVHYPNQKADAYNSVLKEEDYAAWNILVAPRYSNMKNFEWKSIQSWESISFMQADATENESGKTVHIVLFKKHYSKGNGRYLEFVTNNKAAYENEFGPYHNTQFDWDKVANMQWRNKFAVAANDLIGTWSANDYASLTYYYVSTGNSAGTTATATADEFTFLAGNNYKSQHSGASGMVGSMKFSSQDYRGKSAVTDWTITLDNRFHGATEKYNCYFEAIIGGRILLMTDRLGTTYSLAKK
ncbi:MAG: hypothetical protein ABIU77_18480 [Ferruginibacter sp.]